MNLTTNMASVDVQNIYVHRVINRLAESKFSTITKFKEDVLSKLTNCLGENRVIEHVGFSFSNAEVGKHYQTDWGTLCGNNVRICIRFELMLILICIF